MLSEIIDDDNKLEISNIYIKQHKKVQFIVDAIEENKSNIATLEKKIESGKMTKELG